MSCCLLQFYVSVNYGDDLKIACEILVGTIPLRDTLTSRYGVSYRLPAVKEANEAHPPGPPPPETEEKEQNEQPVDIPLPLRKYKLAVYL